MSYAVRVFDHECPLCNPIYWFEAVQKSNVPVVGDLMDILVLREDDTRYARDAYCVVVQEVRIRHSYVSIEHTETFRDYTWGYDLIIKTEAVINAEKFDEACPYPPECYAADIGC